jgi:hypothetical protein
MIPDRIEKLRFIVEEMQIAFHLATQLTDPFLTHTIARQILIRAENFIEHARQLKASAPGRRVQPASVSHGITVTVHLIEGVRKPLTTNFFAFDQLLNALSP